MYLPPEVLIVLIPALIGLLTAVLPKAISAIFAYKKLDRELDMQEPKQRVEVHAASVKTTLDELDAYKKMADMVKEANADSVKQNRLTLDLQDRLTAFEVSARTRITALETELATTKASAELRISSLERELEKTQHELATERRLRQELEAKHNLESRSPDTLPARPDTPLK